MNLTFEAIRAAEEHLSPSYIKTHHRNSNKRLPHVTLQIQRADCHLYRPVAL